MEEYVFALEAVSLPQGKLVYVELVKSKCTDNFEASFIAGDHVFICEVLKAITESSRFGVASMLLGDEAETGERYFF